MSIAFGSPASADVPSAPDLEKLFLLTRNMMSVLTFDGRFEHVSPSWAAALGWSTEELRAASFWDLIHPGDMAPTQEVATRLTAEGGHLVDFKNRYRAKDGSYRLFSWTCFADQAAHRYYCVTRDLTDLTSQADELLRLFQLTDDLIAVGPMDATFELLSPSWEEVLGWTVDELRAKPFTDLIHPDDRGASIAAATGIQGDGGAVRCFENRYRCKDGSYRWLSWTAYADTALDRLYCIARDVTEVRRQQARLDEQAKVWQAFASTLVHDIRSPIRSMAGLAAILERDPGRLHGPDARRYLRMIIARAKEVDDMTTRLLEFASSGHTVLEMGSVDMHAVVLGVIDLVRDEFQGAEPAFNVAPLPAARGDPTLLRTAVMNLIQNACKFSDGARPTVNISANQLDGHVTYVFEDNGIGFEPAIAQRIWEPLVRGHTGKVAGSGLGLATVKRIVEMHGGTVRCESRPGRGARFDISLPA